MTIKQIDKSAIAAAVNVKFSASSVYELKFLLQKS